MQFILISLLVFSSVLHAQEVYKSTDSDGIPLFSDRNRAGAEKLEIEPLPTIKIRTPSSGAAAGSSKPAAKPDTPVYTSVVIENPVEDSVMWATGEPVAVFVAVEPAFGADIGHTIGLRLDGKLAAERFQSGNIALQDVDRGTHTLQAVIFDSTGRIIGESEIVTFHLKRHSILNQR